MAQTYKRDPFQYTGETLEHIPQSVLDIAQGTYDQVTNPLATAQGAYEAVSHPLDTAGRVYGHYATRYKNLPTALDTFRRDPAGAAVDFMPLAMLRRGAGIRPLEGEVMPPNRPMAGGTPGRGGQTVEGRAGGPGLNAPPPRGLEDLSVRSGPPRNVPMSPPRNAFEQNTMDAYYRNTGGGQYGPYTPGARSGFAYRPEHMRRTSDMLQPEPGYVDVTAVQNPSEFYNQGMEDFLAEQMRAGNRDIMRHEYYGRPSGMRPNYGEVPEGYVSPLERMAAPGVRGRSMRPPYGVGGEGKGYFGEMPNPGIEPRPGRGPDGFVLPEGRMPPQGGALVPQGGRMPMGQMPEMAQIPYSPNLPVMASGRGMVPTEIPGEFYEVQGLGAPPRYEMPPMSGPVRVEPAGERAVPPGRAGFPYGPVAAGGAAGLGGLAYFNQREPMANSPLGGNVQNALDPYGFGLGSTAPNRTMQEIWPISPAERQRKLPDMAIRGRKAEGQKAKAKSQQPEVRKSVSKILAEPPAAEQGWEPNLNYLVTSALDRLFGQNEAERGRAFQQYYERNR